MKKVQGFCLLILFFCMILTCVTPASAEPAVEQSSAGCNTLDASVGIAGEEQLLETASAAILYELNSGTMIYSHNPDMRIDPSGMNKIMTALLALEHGDPESVVVVSDDALAAVAYDALRIGLISGEEIKLQDLLYCMMVGSANDAATVIAEHIAGGQDAFVKMMNEKAVSIGCTDTVFMNPSGLSHEQQYTTARDLAKITEEALATEAFLPYFSAIEYLVPATNKSEERTLITTNYLMSTEKLPQFLDERVTGGKTGAFSAEDRSLICTAEKDGVSYLAVVMSTQGTKGSSGVSYSNFRETIALLDYGFENYAMRRLLTTEQVLEQFHVVGGENDVAAAPADALYSMMPVDMEMSELTYRCMQSQNSVTAPVRKGDCVGKVEVWYRSLCVSQCDLVAMHTVEQSGVHNVSLPTKGMESTEASYGTIILISLIVILTGVVIVGAFIVRKRHIPAKRTGKTAGKKKGGRS